MISAFISCLGNFRFCTLGIFGIFLRFSCFWNRYFGSSCLEDIRPDRQRSVHNDVSKQTQNQKCKMHSLSIVYYTTQEWITYDVIYKGYPTHIILWDNALNVIFYFFIFSIYFQLSICRRKYTDLRVFNIYSTTK